MAKGDGFGLHLATCPLCGKDLTHESFIRGGQSLDDKNTPILFAACREHYVEARERFLETFGLPRPGRGSRSTRRTTSEQLPVSARQQLRSMGHVFGGSDRAFAILGYLHLTIDGRILLRDFLAALSVVYHGQETHSAVAALLPQIEHAGWERVAGSGPGADFRSREFALSVRVGAWSPGKKAIHLFLEYGSTGPAVAHYLGEMLPHHARRIVATDPGQAPSGAPWRPPQTPRRLRTADLARRLRDGPCTVLTGAGVSTASGIRTVTGPGSLDAWTRLTEPFSAGFNGGEGPSPHRGGLGISHDRVATLGRQMVTTAAIQLPKPRTSKEPGPGLRLEQLFAGSALDWVLHRPAELASLVGSFQASFIRARPNRGHHALVALERLGLVKQVLTTNFDDLHHSAGSVCIKEIGKADNGSADLRGQVLLAAGVSSDEHGLLRAARASGMDVVVLNPEVPKFVEEFDLYLPGRAEVVLPEVVEMLGP